MKTVWCIHPFKNTQINYIIQMFFQYLDLPTWTSICYANIVILNSLPTYVSKDSPIILFIEQAFKKVSLFKKSKLSLYRKQKINIRRNPSSTRFVHFNIHSICKTCAIKANLTIYFL